MIEWKLEGQKSLIELYFMPKKHDASKDCRYGVIAKAVKFSKFSLEIKG